MSAKAGEPLRADSAAFIQAEDAATQTCQRGRKAEKAQRVGRLRANQGCHTKLARREERRSNYNGYEGYERNKHRRYAENALFSFVTTRHPHRTGL